MVKEKKEKIKSKNDKQEKEKKKKDFQISGYGLFLFLLVFFAVFLVTMFLIHESRTFNLYGFDWEKTKVGDIIVFRTKINVLRPDGKEINYNLHLRKDPRELETIDEFIGFRKNITYISVDNSLSECELAGVSMYNLGAFLGGIGVPAKSATNTLDESINYEQIPYVTCETNPENTVLLIKNSAVSSIEKKGDCYVINVGNCELLKQTETFIVSIVEQFSK